MLVLFVYNEAVGDNLFIPVLRSNLCEFGIESVSSVKEFWNPSQKYDVIHIHWPEAVVGWGVNDISVIEKFELQLQYFHQEGIRIVYTCHNLAPHYGNPLHIEAYRLIEVNANCIIHLGSFSLEKLVILYPDIPQVQIAHHVYLGVYNDAIDKEKARKYLGIPTDRFVITAFGKFRRRDEVLMTIKTFLSFKQKKKLLLVPRMLPSTYPKYILSAVRFILSLLNIYAEENEKILSDDELPYYFASADLIFIPRCAILNSGVVPMAFLFGRAVAGPNIGNVGQLLQATGNLLFDPLKQDTVVSALRRSVSINLNDLGNKNRNYGRTVLHPQKIASLYAKVYKNE